MAVFFQKLRGDGIADPTGVGYWNMWQRRQRPYGELGDGDRVVLIRPRAGRRAAEFAFDVRVDGTPLHDTYDTKDEAIKMIAKYFGYSAGTVRRDPYTQEKGDHPGFAIAWLVGRAHRIDRVVPDGFALGRNGWLILDDVDIAELGL